MTKQTRINFNLDGLNHLRSELDKGFVTRVGVLGADNVREDDGGAGNADIGTVHEFGSETQNIPARSFLRMPLETHGKELMAAIDTKTVKQAIDQGDIKKVFQVIGVEAEKIVQDAFSTGGFGQWPPLKTETIARKGSSAILQDTNQLRRAITSDVVGKDKI